MDEIDLAFYRLTVAQRDHAWTESARHKAERDAARSEVKALKEAVEDLTYLLQGCRSDRKALEHEVNKLARLS